MKGLEPSTVFSALFKRRLILDRKERYDSAEGHLASVADLGDDDVHFLAEELIKFKAIGFFGRKTAAEGSFDECLEPAIQVRRGHQPEAPALSAEIFDQVESYANQILAVVIPTGYADFDVGDDYPIDAVAERLLDSLAHDWGHDDIADRGLRPVASGHRATDPPPAMGGHWGGWGGSGGGRSDDS
jgi:hypothetical protein